MPRQLKQVDNIESIYYDHVNKMKNLHDYTISILEEKSNRTPEIEKMSEVLGNFYNEFNNGTDYIVITLYIPVIILAFVANIMVIIVILKYQYMRSVTNYFVVNLSIADLLVTVICMPVAISQAISTIWIHGELMCKLFFYLQGVAVAASVFTITAMSIDRYFAIRSPIALRRNFNRKNTMMIIAALWVVSLSIFAPVLKAATLQSPDLHNITLRDQQEDGGEIDGVEIIKPPVIQFCLEDFKPLGINAHVFGMFCFFLIYAIPGFVVISTYSLMGRTLCARKPPFDSDNNEGSASSQQGFRLVRERKRIAWILLTLAVLFALCWLPYNVLQLLIDLGIIYEGSVIPTVRSYCLFLGHANSALNPIVYCFMTRNFRRSVAGLICGTRREYHRSNSNRNNRADVGAMCVGSSLKQCGGWDLRRPREFAIAAAARPRRRSMALERSATSSSGYNSSHSRHSPHRRCYMLKSMPPQVDEAAVALCSLKKINTKQESHLASSLNDVDDKTRGIFGLRRSQSLHAFSTITRHHEDSANLTIQLITEV